MDTTATDRPRGRDMLHVPRTRGALSGTLIVAAGIWGALIPLVGPYFDFGFTTEAWSWTANQFWLSLLPGIAAVVAGLILLYSGNRATAAIGAAIAVVAGVWFIVGPPLSQIWNPGAFGTPLGGKFRQAVILVSFFYGLGALILFLGSSALGRLSVVGVRDVAAARNRRLGKAEPTGRHARGHRRHAHAGEAAGAGTAGAGAAAGAGALAADHPQRAEYPEHEYPEHEYPGRGGRGGAEREPLGAGRDVSRREPVGGDRYDEASVYPDEPYPYEPRRSHNGHDERRATAGRDRGGYSAGTRDQAGRRDAGGRDIGGRESGRYGTGGDADSEYGDAGYGDGGYGGYEVGKHRSGEHPAAGSEHGRPAPGATDGGHTAEHRPEPRGDEPIGAGSGARSHRHHWWERH
ncbi:MFS transporter [Parafrankia elaeagni]|uniref:MFS transporter n=1 Tax=Parafrankia elaeagni TaxID=222534 RepID=UPI00039EA91C|nr:MFS transporter [Parafrankia elaeagni]